MDKPLLISVIIPTHNSSKNLRHCIDALTSSSYQPFEIIVIDDCSSDDSVKISLEKGVKVHKLDHQSGPAAARNFGARKASGEVLFFVDSDVIVQNNTLERISHDFKTNPDIVAVFGSYDDSPFEQDNLSQFRNLFHHFIHQNSDPNAKTFWAGCGAVYRDVFHKLNGFNEQLYTKPSIEDIELGIRISKKGYKIMLDKDLQVKHLKKWSWISWLKADILNRAFPWSKLLIENGFLSSDLNLKISYRISSVLAVLLFLIIILIFLDTLEIFRTGFIISFLLISIILIIAIIILNFDLYRFFFKKRGLTFMLISIPLHFIYYIYSGFTFTFCWIQNKFPSF